MDCSESLTPAGEEKQRQHNSNVIEKRGEMVYCPFPRRGNDYHLSKIE
jgi:hypothetical protein